jgi:uncharacterized protein (TIRG00374 family)
MGVAEMDSKTRVSLRSFTLLLVGIAAFILYIYLFNVDIPKILGEMQRANPHFYLLALIASFLDVFFFAVSWHFLLLPLSIKPRFRKTFLFVWVSLFIDLLIPAEAVSGEISKIYLMTRDHEEETGKIVASLVVQRILGTLVTTLTLVLGFLALFMNQLLEGFILNLMVLVTVGTAISLIFLVLLCIKETWTLWLVDSAIKFADYVTRGRWKLQRLHEKALEATRMFHQAVKSYGMKPESLLPPIAAYILAWISNIFVFYFVFLSLSLEYHQISWSGLMVTSAILVAIKAVPLGVPFEVGLPEITMSTLFFFLVVRNMQVCITATILIRILTVWVRFLIGFLAQQALGIHALATLSTEGLIEETSEKDSQ